MNQLKKKLIEKLKKLIKKYIFIGGVFPKKTWSRLNFGVLGPEKCDSSSKTAYMVLFPG